MRIPSISRHPLIACVALTFALAATGPVRAQGDPRVTLDLQFESALELAAIFEQSDVSDADLDRVYQLAGVQALVHQAARFDDRATEANFKETLRAVVQGEFDESAHDPFEFRWVRKSIENIRGLIRLIQADPEGLAADLAARIGAYCPAGIEMDVTVHIVVGGTSDGWTRDGVFHVALQYYRDDFEGLKLLMAHELYHVAQGEFMVESEIGDDQPGLQRAAQLLAITTAEGSASVVGDPLRATGGRGYVDWFGDKYRRNLKRIRGNFALFEALLHWSHDDPEFDFGELYNMGFSGNSDSRLYYVGYVMGKAIERHDGTEALVALLQQPVTALFLRYDEISRLEDDPTLPRLGAATTDLLRTLHELGV